MATEAQIKANRMNALKSTGPRSKEGKDAVSQNATKHGLCSCRNVIKSESQEEYNQFRDEMIDDLAPAGAMELMLAERIANLSWRLKRAEVFQNAAIESMVDDTYDLSFNSYVRARNQAEQNDMSLVLGIAIRRDFDNSRILEHLLIYEKRIEASLYRATAELRKLQKIRMNDERRRMMDEGRDRTEDATRSFNDGGETNDDLKKQSQFERENRIQDSEDSIENNEDCRADFQSSRNDMVNQNLNAGYSTQNADENIRLRSDGTTP